MDVDGGRHGLDGWCVGLVPVVACLAYSRHKKRGQKSRVPGWPTVVAQYAAILMTFGRYSDPDLPLAGPGSAHGLTHRLTNFPNSSRVRRDLLSTSWTVRVTENGHFRVDPLGMG